MSSRIWTPRLTGLLLLLSVLASATVVLAPQDPLVKMRLAQWLSHPAPITPAADIADQERNDPDLGITFPRTAQGAQLTALAAQSPKGLVLILLQSCLSCVNFDHADWARAAKREGFTLVIASGGSAKDAALYRRSLPKDVILLHDSDHSLHNTFNGYYSVRPYLFNRKGVLIWKGTQFGASSHFGQVTGLIEALKKEQTDA